MRKLSERCEVDRTAVMKQVDAAGQQVMKESHDVIEPLSNHCKTHRMFNWTYIISRDTEKYFHIAHV